MIIKGKHKNTVFNLLKILSSLAILLLFLFILTKVNTRTNEKTNANPTNSNSSIIYCGAENIVAHQFNNNGIQFGNANLQTKSNKRSGKYASKTDGTNNIGFKYILQNPTPGDSYKASVWSYSRAEIKRFITVSSTDKAIFNISNSHRIETDGNWWQRIEVYFTIPSTGIDSLIVECYKDNGTEVVFFDDFKIEKIDTKDLNNKVSDNYSLFRQKLHLQIDKSGQEQLLKIRKRAYARGFLIQEKSDKIKAKIINKSASYKIKMRYKGDWLDHLMSSSPSYRIEMKSDNSWNTLQVFSIQHPKARGYLREWVYHDFLNKHDILTPRYDFIKLQLNEEKEKTYAIEEHFTKNLVEHKARREGPIVRYSEDRFWEGMRRSTKYKQALADGSNKTTALWTSEITPFKLKKTKKSKSLSNQFNIAQNLMQQYKYGQRKASEIFDLDRLAKYMVITDICMAHHALTWHNQRFYYNPVTSLLEPIAFDGFGTEDPHEYASTPYANQVYGRGYNGTEPMDRFFYDKDFVAKYMKYLHEFTDLSYINEYMSSIEEELSNREDFLKVDFPNYQYNRNELILKSKEIITHFMPFTNSLQVYQTNTIPNKSTTVNLYNAHSIPLEIIGTQKRPSKSIESIVVYPQSEGEVPNYTAYEIPAKSKWIYYKIPGVDSIFRTIIPPWNTPNEITPRQELMHFAEQSDSTIYSIIGNTIVFESKTYDINEPVIIPANKVVIIKPGTILRFGSAGFLISYSAIHCRGEIDNPIIIDGLDKTAGSLTILQATEESSFRHVTFKNQNTLDYKGWKLTGGVSLYESDGVFLHCRFLDNGCEDALNIVRSNFDISYCVFSNIYGDAFDADFCTGDIKNSKFIAIGNDGIDYSGTISNIENVTMDIVGDKGISAGEHATVNAQDVKINHAKIGFASKDLSQLSLRGIEINNCEQGFVAFQKKPEFGPATIKLWPHTHDNVKHLFMIENSSRLEHIK